MQDAESSNHALGTPEVLRAAGQWLVSLCDDFGCSVVIAASRSAEWIVAAAVMTAGGALRTDLGGGSRVMVVEAAAVTGAAVHHAGQVARAEGATWVGAAVWKRTRPDLDELELGRFDVIAASSDVSPT